MRTRYGEWEGRTRAKDDRSGSGERELGMVEWEGIMRTRDGGVGGEIASEGWGSGRGERDQGKGEW